MDTKDTKVGLAKTGRRRANVFEALDNIREVLTPKVREQVLLKPNFLSSTNQLASSHPDAIRGALDFLLSTPQPPKEVIIAEGANEKFSGEAFQIFGYEALQAEYDLPIRLVDLHQETDWVKTKVFLAERNENTVRMPKIVLDCPCTISVAIAKTHDAGVVTLAMKNMIMGTLHKEDRIKMHGYHSHADRVLPREAQTLNINLLRLSRYLKPDIAIVDGTVGLQGNGPGGTDSVPLGVAIASDDVFAADAVTTRAMGFQPLEIGLFHYANEMGYGTADLDKIDVVGPAVETVSTSFKPHETAELQFQWQETNPAEYLAAD
ncbi:DUF362 domain-containing protein [Candidatus Poribacteria bacterium]|nr:DUF362 domain-containing protein [Candidatus Poribacteria bacterium]MYK20071.1 DUF362 domain-containing protein [Candidatus Poribacteria bacterium]